MDPAEKTPWQDSPTCYNLTVTSWIPANQTVQMVTSYLYSSEIFPFYLYLEINFNGIHLHEKNWSYSWLPTLVYISEFGRLDEAEFETSVVLGGDVVSTGTTLVTFVSENTQTAKSWVQNCPEHKMMILQKQKRGVSHSVSFHWSRTLWAQRGMLVEHLKIRTTTTEHLYPKGLVRMFNRLHSLDSLSGLDLDPRLVWTRLIIFKRRWRRFFGPTVPTSIQDLVKNEQKKGCENKLVKMQITVNSCCK